MRKEEPPEKPQKGTIHKKVFFFVFCDLPEVPEPLGDGPEGLGL
jgi:hypothetical protein